MENSNKDLYNKSDTAYLIMIGAYLRQERIAQKKTQAALAIATGVNRSTIVNLEKGNAVNMMSFIQVLRQLDLLYFLTYFNQKPRFSPLKLADLENKEIHRVRSKNKDTKNKVTKDLDW